MTTVRERTFEVLRHCAMTTLFANPGSTEIAFLCDLPADVDLVLGLHEGTVVGMATGWAIGKGRPALVVLHTTAGLGNAVGALATARVNRAPLVVVVGQQDRRHLALEPFLAGHLDGLAGSYPVWTDQPVRPEDVPGAINRAWHEASHGRGPAIVVVPMDDWDHPCDDVLLAAPSSLRHAAGVERSEVEELARLVEAARSPAIVAGAGAADEASWAGLVGLAEDLSCPVFQESFGARPGFPQDHPLFAGHLPAARDRLRAVLEPYDLVVSVGAPVFRQYAYVGGPFVVPPTILALVTDDPAEAHRSPVDLAVLGPIAPICEALRHRLAATRSSPDRSSPDRSSPDRSSPDRSSPDQARAHLAGRSDAGADPPRPGEPLRGGQVLAALAERLPRDVVLVEETPSTRPDLHRLVPARSPLGFVSAAMGGLGFAMPAAIGLRFACPDRPVVAVVGDGSSLYAIQSLWSAARYRAGVLFVVLANGRYAVMDRLAEQAGGAGSWPGFEEIRTSVLATGFGCESVSVATHDNLVRVLDDVVPTLADRRAPLLLEVTVEADGHFEA